MGPLPPLSKISCTFYHWGLLLGQAVGTGLPSQSRKTSLRLESWLTCNRTKIVDKSSFSLHGLPGFGSTGSKSALWAHQIHVRLASIPSPTATFKGPITAANGWRRSGPLLGSVTTDNILLHAFHFGGSTSAIPARVTLAGSFWAFLVCCPLSGIKSGSVSILPCGCHQTINRQNGDCRQPV